MSDFSDDELDAIIQAAMHATRQPWESTHTTPEEYLEFLAVASPETVRALAEEVIALREQVHKMTYLTNRPYGEKADAVLCTHPTCMETFPHTPGYHK